MAQNPIEAPSSNWLIDLLKHIFGRPKPKG